MTTKQWITVSTIWKNSQTKIWIKKKLFHVLTQIKSCKFVRFFCFRKASYETDLSNEFRSFFAHFVQTVPCQSNHCSRPFCILHTSWYRAAGRLKILVGTRLFGGHNLSPKIRIGFMYLMKIGGDQPFRSYMFRRPCWWQPAARTHGQSHVS